MYKNGDTTSCLEFEMEAAFGFDNMEDPNDRVETKNRLDNFIKEQESMTKFSDEEKTFIEFIRKRAEEPPLDESK